MASRHHPVNPGPRSTAGGGAGGEPKPAWVLFDPAHAVVYCYGPIKSHMYFDIDADGGSCLRLALLPPDVPSYLLPIVCAHLKADLISSALRLIDPKARIEQTRIHAAFRL